jgi:hypothetical protein
MTTHPSKQKLFCFVDETGQDDRAELFIVVTVISIDDQDALKEALMHLEQRSKVGSKKWHKSRSPEREGFLELAINAQIASGRIFFGRHRKPVPFFQPMVETLCNAIELVAAEDYQAVVYVDGIDRKKARELTGALRERGVKAQHVRSARDESEPLIRLADRWAGCIRGRFEGNEVAAALVLRAIETGYLKEV